MKKEEVYKKQKIKFMKKEIADFGIGTYDGGLIIKEPIEKYVNPNKFTNHPWTNWKLISRHKGLSEDFIRKFQHKLCWDLLVEHQKMSDKFKREMSRYLKHKKIYDETKKSKTNLRSSSLAMARKNLNKSK